MDQGRWLILAIAVSFIGLAAVLYWYTHLHW
jgi:hypothetical protein